MSDEDTIKSLCELSQFLGDRAGIFRDPAWRKAIDVALDRITNNPSPAPLPADTVPVRIAVAVDSDGWVNGYALNGEEPWVALISVESMIKGRGDKLVASAVIVANLPRRSIPVVTATVQEVKP